MDVNVIGQINLFEAIRLAGIDPMVHIAGSSEEYGLVFPDEVPMKETNPLRPLSAALPGSSSVGRRPVATPWRGAGSPARAFSGTAINRPLGASVPVGIGEGPCDDGIEKGQVFSCWKKQGYRLGTGWQAGKVLLDDRHRFGGIPRFSAVRMIHAEDH